MTNIFQEGSTQNPPASSATTEFEHLLESIQNDEGKPKYQNVEEALKALKHSQEYIPELKTKLSAYEQQIADAKAQLDQQAKLEDIIATITSGARTDNGDDNPAASGLDEQTVIKLVQQQIADLDNKKTAAANTDLVQTTLTAKYGDKTAEIVQAKAAELGTSPKLLGELAEKSPQLVLKLFGTEPVKNLNTSTSSVNVPPINQPKGEVSRPAKSVLSGATSKEQMSHFHDIRQSIYAKHGITS